MSHLRRSHSGFTLTELLLVVAIIGIVSSLGLMVLRGAEEDALKKRTQSQIERINKVLDPKLEEFQVRIVPIRMNNAQLQEIQVVQTAAIEELMAAEMPTRPLDLLDNGQYTFPKNEKANPSSYDWSAFPDSKFMIRLRAKLQMPLDGSGQGAWTDQYAGAECLYAFLSLSYLEDGRAAIEILREHEIDDVDGDGNNEVVDAFGDPLDVDLVDALTGQHINPVYDPTDVGIPGVIQMKDPPTTAQQYRFVITSPNLDGKLD